MKSVEMMENLLAKYADDREFIDTFLQLKKDMKTITIDEAIDMAVDYLQRDEFIMSKTEMDKTEILAVSTLVAYGLCLYTGMQSNGLYKRIADTSMARVISGEM